ncbi:MAG: hypothetical protein JHC40_18715 [Burkholderiales bacterium]|nr:hypothetical protein [Burkholderiales bacterium]
MFFSFMLQLLLGGHRGRQGPAGIWVVRAGAVGASVLLAASDIASKPSKNILRAMMICEALSALPRALLINPNRAALDQERSSSGGLIHDNRGAGAGDPPFP